MDTIQIIGYIASVIIAVSMTMSSIVKFRWINLAGAVTFSTYGFLLGAVPVGILNGFIVVVDVYYLIRIYSKKELFSVLEVQKNSKYLLEFLKFHNKDIQKYLPGFEYKPQLNTISFYILRNMVVAGVFLAHPEGDDVLKVGLDYVNPQYRDYRNGKYVYHWLRNKLLEAGFKTIRAYGFSAQHIKYLKKMGFHETANGLYFEKEIEGFKS